MSQALISAIKSQSELDVPISPPAGLSAATSANKQSRKELGRRAQSLVTNHPPMSQLASPRSVAQWVNKHKNQGALQGMEQTTNSSSLMKLAQEH